MPSGIPDRTLHCRKGSPPPTDTSIRGGKVRTAEPPSYEAARTVPETVGGPEKGKNCPGEPRKSVGGPEKDENCPGEHQMDAGEEELPSGGIHKNNTAELKGSAVLFI